MAYDFPNAPTVGQVYSGYSWDGEKWMSVASPSAPSQSGVISIQVFTASGQYTPSANMTTCVVECWGGGGAGGGALATASTTLVGGGGGGGGYSRSMLTAAQIGVAQAVTIGAPGSVGAAGNNAGNAGGDTTFGGTIVVAKGGLGGLAGTFSQPGGRGAVAGTGNFTAIGPSSGNATGDSAATMNIAIGAQGASTAVGGGGGGGNSSGSGTNGFAATGYAAGGGGGSSSKSTVTTVGGAGAPGIVVITEYGMTALSPATAQLGSVRYDLPQGLTANQTAQARANIWVTKKNYIINGAMMVSQENGATVGTTSPYYLADQFFIQFGHGGANNVAQVASRTSGGSTNRIRVTVTTADAAVAATDYSFLCHRIEGLRAADLNFGGVNAKTITLQFGCKAPAGTYCVAFRNSGATRTYFAEYVIAAGEANTDVVRSITIPGDAAGAWLTDNTLGLEIMWALMAGSSFAGAGGVWGTVNGIATANQFNFMGTINNVFELFDVSLVEGSVAPPFQVPDYASELALCQRYYEKNAGNQTAVRFSGNITTSGVYYATLYFKTVKRGAPIVVLTDTGPSGFPVTSGTPNVATDGFFESRTANATGAGVFSSSWTANARL